jgi:membrane protease YdiL (CAAX protease family)
VHMRFCSLCGRARHADQPCSCRTASGAPAVRHEIKVPKLRAALALYFSLLALLLLPMFGVDAVGELVISGCMSVLVLSFSIALRRELRPVMALTAWKWCAWGALVAPLTFAIASVACLTLNVVFDVPELSYVDAYTEAGYGWTVILLSLCLQPAVIEELAFRGVVFTALRRALGPAETIVVSSVMFMALHFSPVCWLHLFVMGVALGYLRHRSGSLMPGVVLHFAHNFLVMLTSA